MQEYAVVCRNVLSIRYVVISPVVQFNISFVLQEIVIGAKLMEGFVRSMLLESGRRAVFIISVHRPLPLPREPCWQPAAGAIDCSVP